MSDKRKFQGQQGNKEEGERRRKTFYQKGIVDNEASTMIGVKKSITNKPHIHM